MNAIFPTAVPPQSIVQTLAAWRERTPERVALTVLRDGEQVESTTTYGALHERVLQLARGLRQMLPRGSRVVLLPAGVEFVSAFYACLAAGMVAVPAHHPQQPRKVALWKKLQAVVEASGAAMIIAPAKSLDVLSAMKAGERLFAGCRFDTVESVVQAGAGVAPDPLPMPAGGDLAILQYTSGSTGAPKGVMLTHANLLANQAVIAALMGHDAGTRVVSWLPLYHDMGLSAVLQMASEGCSLVMMSPQDFVQQPLRWLRAIAAHRAHTSGGPNFAYQLAAAALRSPAAAGLDLSSWQVAFCGAEPIHRQTVTEFLAAAAPHGLDARAFFPCYGMAEATVMVTGAARGAGVKYLEVGNAQLAGGRVQPAAPGAADAKSLVACGRPAEGHEIRIVGHDGRPVADAWQVGEVWVRGPSVGEGYYAHPQASASTFGARLPGGEGGFLRTGDLGAVVDGELYITGRVKDLLIVRGRNLYPQDVEDCVQDAVPGLRRGCGAAVSVTVDEEEKLVVVQEIGRTQRRQMDIDEVFSRIVVALNDDFGVTPHQVVLVEPATIEKTSSGKIARALCRRAYLQGELRVVAVWSEGKGLATASPAAAPAVGAVAASGPDLRRREIEQRIAEAAAAFLQLDAARVPRTKPWAEMGFDSVNALQLAARVQQVTGLSLNPTVLWDCANIEALAAYLAQQQEAASLQPAAAPLPPEDEALQAMSEAEAEARLLKELAR